MSASDRIQASSSHVSLANNAASGTTFAAKARAAELNAARARRETRELEESEVPAASPVSLGALTKFVKPRNKGKATWKPFNLNEGQENGSQGRSDRQEDRDDSGSSSEYEVQRPDAKELVQRSISMLRDITNVKNPHPLRQELVSDDLNSNSQDSELSPALQRLQQIGVRFDVNEWDAHLSAGSPTKTKLPFKNTTSPARELAVEEFDDATQIATHVPQAELHLAGVGADTDKPDRKLGLLSPVKVDSSSTGMNQADPQFGLSTRADISSSRTLSADTILPFGQEAKLASLGVLPPVTRNLSKYLIQPVPPATDVAVKYDQPGSGIHTSDSQTYASAYQLEANPPRQYYSSMNMDFRFPPQQELAHYHQTQHLNHQPHHQLNPFEGHGYFPAIPPAQMGPYAQGVHDYSVNPSIAPASSLDASGGHQPFYGGPPMTNKRDILLKSLHDVVESSRARESTRTVLYDPVAQGELLHSWAAEAERATEPVQSEHAVLQDSEPLPGWRSRPVNIHDELTPVLTNTELAIVSKGTPAEVSPSNASTVAVPRVSFPPTDFSTSSFRRNNIYEGAEEWWRADNRGLGDLRVYLNQVADEDKARKQLNTAEQNSQAAHNHGNLGYTWPDVPRKTDNDHPAAADVANRLLIEVLANFQEYLAGPLEVQRSRWGSFGPVPEWCIDKSVGGSSSFFGEDWGAPPPRVGRDPRYRPMLHEPRYTLFEELERRGTVGDIYGRRFR